MQKKRVFINNPVIFKGLGLAPLIVAGRDFDSAVLMSFAVLMLLVSTRISCSIINHVWDTKHKAVLYALVAGICYVGVFFVLNRIFGIAELLSYGLYLPLLVIDPIIIKRSERHTREPLSQAIIKSFLTSIGFAVAIFVIASLREFLAYGTINDIVIIETALFPLARLASGGFIVAGIVAALWKVAIVAFWKFIEMGAKGSQ